MPDHLPKRLRYTMGNDLKESVVPGINPAHISWKKPSRKSMGSSLLSRPSGGHVTRPIACAAAVASVGSFIWDLHAVRTYDVRTYAYSS